MCGHKFCGICLVRWLAQHQSCPVCRVPPATAFAPVRCRCVDNVVSHLVTSGPSLRMETVEWRVGNSFGTRSGYVRWSGWVTSLLMTTAARWEFARASHRPGPRGFTCTYVAFLFAWSPEPCGAPAQPLCNVRIGVAWLFSPLSWFGLSQKNAGIHMSLEMFCHDTRGAAEVQVLTEMRKGKSKSLVWPSPMPNEDWGKITLADPVWKPFSATPAEGYRTATKFSLRRV